MPEAVFNMLVLVVKLFIQIKQINCKLIVGKPAGGHGQPALQHLNLIRQPQKREHVRAGNAFDGSFPQHYKNACCRGEVNSPDHL